MKTKHKNVLAENMLRFGVKNLNESQLFNVKKRLLTEQSTLPDTIDLPAWCEPVHNILKEKSTYYADLAKNVEGQFTRYDIKFTICTLNQLVALILIGGGVGSSGYVSRDRNRDSQDLSRSGASKAKDVKRDKKGLKGLFSPKSWHIFGNIDMKKDPEGWANQITDTAADDAAAAKRWDTLARKYVTKGSEFQILPTDEGPATLKTQGAGSVLTYGVITPTSISNPEDPGQSSKFEDVILFCNNASIAAMFGNYTDYAADELDVTNGINDDGFSYDDAQGAGSGDFVTNVAYREGDAQAPGKGKILVVQPDGMVTADGNNWFEVGKTALTPNIAAEIMEDVKAAIAAGGTITQYSVVGSASGDEPVNGVTGFPEGHDVNTPYQPKNPSESANAKLAFDRAQVIVELMKSAGVTVQPDIQAFIQPGKEKARYGKLSARWEVQGEQADVNKTKQLFTTAGGTSMGEGVIEAVEIFYTRE